MRNLTVVHLIVEGKIQTYNDLTNCLDL